MNQSKIFWDNAAKDPEVRYKYIADEWASTETFLNLIESNNSNWNNALEIGCGIGRLLDPLSEKYKDCNSDDNCFNTGYCSQKVSSDTSAEETAFLKRVAYLTAK